MSATPTEEKEPKKKRGIYILLIIIIAAAIAGTGYWYKIYSSYVTSDDAYIESDRVAVGAKILGRIVELRVDEGDTVKEGELIAELDSAELKAHLEQSYAMKTQIEANIAQARAKNLLDEKSIKVQEINLQTAKDDYNRSEKQHKGGVITDEKFEHDQKNYKTAQALYETALQEVKLSHTQVLAAQASLASNDAQINLIQTQLQNTKINSPVDGVVAKRWLLAGDIASPGEPIVTITTNSKKWVLSYIEETKLQDLHLNQPAEFTVDAFPGLVFHGKLFYIGSNTAGQFSLIPPDNASGNFTKVTQRVPIKISYDSVDGADRSNVKLVSGMSVVIKIKK